MEADHKRILMFMLLVFASVLMLGVVSELDQWQEAAERAQQLCTR